MCKVLTILVTYMVCVKLTLVKQFSGDSHIPPHVVFCDVQQWPFSIRTHDYSSTHTHAHAHTHTHTRTNTHTHMHTRTHARTHARNTRTHAHTHTRTHARTHTHMRTHTHSTTLSQILKLLEAMNMRQYQGVFMQEQIDGEVLCECDDTVLGNDLKVSSKLHRTRLLKVISGRHSVRNILEGQDPYVDLISNT